MTTPTLPADWTLPKLPEQSIVVRVGEGNHNVWGSWKMQEFALAAAQSAYAAGFRDGAMACATACDNVQDTYGRNQMYVAACVDIKESA